MTARGFEGYQPGERSVRGVTAWTYVPVRPHLLTDPDGRTVDLHSA
ncbi:hypothetical protein ACFVS9_31670 [Streptomyces sp. NPDC058008]